MRTAEGVKMDPASNNTKLDRDVAHYLATGECDALGCAFTGRNSIECITGYASEAYSRMREQARGPAQRSALLTQFAAGPRSSDERVDHDELIDILSEAIAAHNGWKRILARCSVPQRHGQRQAVILG